MSEPTATGPNGEKVVFRGGQWVPMGGGAPAPVMGPPPDQFKVRDQQLQEQAAVRAQSDQAMQAEKFRWEQSTRNPDGSEKPKIITDGKPTEYQSKSAGFLGRMLQAEKFYKGVPENSRDPRSMAGQTMHDWTPDLENSLPTFLGGNSPERQQADQAARNFITASLRQESGATIKQEEFDTQYRIFFPMPGDSPAVLAQKAAARAQAIEGFRVAAGQEAKKIEADPSKPIVRSGRTGMAYNFEVPEGADDATILAAAKAYLQKKEPGEDRNPVFSEPRGQAAAQGKRLKYNPATGELE